MTLKNDLYNIDNGRFKSTVDALMVVDSCYKCNCFNLSIKDVAEQYRCKCMGSCICATLHPNLISYINRKLELISENEHLDNINTTW
jgi:flavoprotein